MKRTGIMTDAVDESGTHYEEKSVKAFSKDVQQPAAQTAVPKTEEPPSDGSSRLLSRRFIAIFLINMIGGAYGVMSLSTMVSYCLSRGLGDMISAAISAVFPLTCFLLRPLSGMLCNRYDREKMFYLGIACYVVSPAAFLMEMSVPAMLLARAGQGLGMALVTTAAGAIVVGVIPKENFGAGIGIYSLGLTISGSIAPGLALWLVSVFGYGGMFLTTMGMAAAAGLLMPMARTKEGAFPKVPRHASLQESGPDQALNNAARSAGAAASGDSAGEAPAARLSSLYERRSLIPTLLALAVGVIHVSITQYLSIAAESAGVVQDVSAFYVMSTIGIVAIRLLDVKLNRMLGSRRTILIGFGCEMSAGLLLAFFLSRQLAPVWVGLIYGAGYSLVWTLLNVWALEGIEEERQGSANSTFLAASDLSYFAGPLFWGAVCSADGYDHIYVFAVALMLVCLMLCLGADRKRARSARPEPCQ